MIDRTSEESLFRGKVVLITGGTGFIGRALTKKILSYNPHSIRIFSRDEVKHHHLQQEFNNDPRLRSLIGDIRDRKRLEHAMKGVNIVIHAAALKRLDILEYNVQESLKTNIVGTQNLVNACLANEVDIAAFISTDKACSPVNTYGACKFVSERIFVESNYSKGSAKTIFTVVRYGNVLDSTGSIVPFLRKRLQTVAPITLTDPRMTRFIISADQAVKLIFKGLLLAVGGELFVPKLPAFNVVDLITLMKEHYGANNEVVKIGIRPGEKIHELMINEAEVRRTFNFEDLYVITSSIQKHQDIATPEYVKRGTQLTEESMKEYSSKDAVISLPELKKLFDELKVL